MKAISIRQPWAWCIVRPDVPKAEHRKTLGRFHDIKPVENRTWATKYRGPLFLHAARKIDLEAFAWIRAHFPRLALKLPEPGSPELQTGGIIGRALLVDCVENHPSPWAIPGQWHHVLDEVEPVPFVEQRGELGLFEVPGLALPSSVPLPPRAYERTEHRRRRTL